MKTSGFTLLEIVVVVGIVAVLGTLSLVSFSNSRKVRDLTTTGQNVLSVLQAARAKAAAGEEGSQWGVHVDASQVVLFRGALYSASTSTTAYTLPSTIEIVSIDLAGGHDAVFKRIDGSTKENGSFVVRVKGSSTQTFPVAVDPDGNSYLAGTAPAPVGARIVDARHRAFALGWSIKTATTLTLNFNDSSVIDSIPMAGYFNADKSAFDWSGTVAVSGLNQALRIHATSLSDATTTLSVDHDCRRNNQKLDIAIDGQDIATFVADCKSVSLGTSGGVMSEP